MQGFWNGCAWFAAFRTDAGHTGIFAADGTGSAISTPTLTDVALNLTDDVANDLILTSSVWQPDATGVQTATISSSDPTCEDFLKVAAPAKAGSTSGLEKKEYVSEKGGKVGGKSSGSGIPYIVISALGYNDTEVLVKMAVVNFSPESGKVQSKPGELQIWDLKITSVAAKAEIIIPNACFDADVFDISPAIEAALRTIEASAYVQTSRMLKAA